MYFKLGNQMSSQRKKSVPYVYPYTFLLQYSQTYNIQIIYYSLTFFFLILRDHSLFLDASSVLLLTTTESFITCMQLMLPTYFPVMDSLFPPPTPLPPCVCPHIRFCRRICLGCIPRRGIFQSMGISRWLSRWLFSVLEACGSRQFWSVLSTGQRGRVTGDCSQKY